MIATALRQAMAGEVGRAFGLEGHPFLPMYVMNLGDRPGLLIDVELPSGAALDDGQGFDITQLNRSGRRSVLVKPARAGIATPAFVGLVEFVFRETSNVATRQASIVALLDSVNEFRRFFARRADRLSEDAVRGLFSELELLLQLVSRGMRAEDALIAWSGPYRGTDFAFIDRGAIEVKSTHVPAQTVRISSEYQLAGTSGSIHLFVRPLSTLAANGTVGRAFLDVVAEAKSTLTREPGAKALWTSAFEALGFDESDSYYSQWRFVATEWQAYVIGDGFPRITPEDIPDGVRSVAYSIDLNSLEAFREDGGSVLEKLVAAYA